MTEQNAKSKLIISIIAALGRNNVIGNRNGLPWHLPADLQHFKELTKGKPIIMGSKTFESIGKPLPQRDNIVLTRDSDYKAEGCKIARSLDEALQLAEQGELGKASGEVMICGGESVYKQFLPLAQRMYLTFIDGDFEGDAYFPEFDKTEWKEVAKENRQADIHNPYNYSFVVLARR